MQLDKDDRSGAATDGENLLVSGANSQYIKRLAVFAFIYEGVKKWSQADAVVTIHSADAPVTINLDETRDGVGMCAICMIEGSAVRLRDRAPGAVRIRAPGARRALRMGSELACRPQVN